MTKLLGTIVGFFMLAPIMAQQPKTIFIKKDSSRQFTDSIRNLPPLEVSAVRVSENSPFAKSNINKASINQNNFGQDLPYLIQNTPSVVVNSDAGTGIGYTALRIRGTDATRINVTLNGIPYNDAESMGTYFVDLPDFGSSVHSIQIQRGVGTSTNGASAFGATMNLATNDYRPQSYFGLQSSAGSFNSYKNTLHFGTGLLHHRFTIDGRASKITSDGYIDRAKSNLKSFYLSSTYWGDHSSLRWNVFSGWEKTYQAWYGVPEELLASNRTYNPAGMEKADTPYNNQTDNYNQTHYQLFYNYSINTYLKWNTALFLTRGKGYYEEYKAGVTLNDYTNLIPSSYPPIDIVRRKWLDNNFYGQIASISYEKTNNIITLGGAWNTYDGLHYGRLPYMHIANFTANDNYYFNNAIKKDFNAYAKWTHQFNTLLSSFLDLQYRDVMHNMYGFDHNPSLTVNRKFNFFNPKAGITYKQDKTTYYASIAVAHKEPNRDDFEAAVQEQPKHETVYDIEAGWNKKGTDFQWAANFYFMNYKDQLVLTGKINDIGSYTRINVPKSYRAGIELEETWKMHPKFTSSGNITISQNKIDAFTEYYDDYDNGGQIAVPHRNTNIALSPSITAAHQFSYVANPKLTFHAQSKYVSKQYLDNTQNESRILKPYFLQDLSVQYQLFNTSKWSAQIQIHVNNILDKKYEPNGYTYSYLWGAAVTTSNNYYPMAGRNYWLTLKFDLK